MHRRPPRPAHRDAPLAPPAGIRARLASGRVLRLAGALLMAAVLGCEAPPPEAPVAPTPETAEAYLGDRAHRRAVLEAALWRPELPYSRSLLSGYALPEGGWELLPPQRDRVAPFRVADAARLAAGEALDLADAETLRPEVTPETEAEWRALGERVFYRLPMRADAWLDWVAARPEHWAAVGLAAEPDGTVRGLVRFAEPDGRVRVGLSCAFCHAGDGQPGRGDRQRDTGAGRALFAEARGLDASPLWTWGPGRVDVTDAGLDNPTAIPDLYNLEHARFLNHSGVIRVGGRTTFAVRFETQYILGHRMQSRPPRALMWALASYVLALEPPAEAAPDPGLDPGPGADLFARHCAGCHQPARGYAGGLMPAEQMHTDPQVAFDPERGTGHYQIPSLRGVRHNAPYLHDGSQPSLQALLADGHPQGAVLPMTDRAALIQYLQTL